MRLIISTNVCNITICFVIFTFVKLIKLNTMCRALNGLPRAVFVSYICTDYYCNKCKKQKRRAASIQCVAHGIKLYCLNKVNITKQIVIKNNIKYITYIG